MTVFNTAIKSWERPELRIKVLNIMNFNKEDRRIEHLLHNI